jgi:hypothetical protein
MLIAPPMCVHFSISDDIRALTESQSVCTSKWKGTFAVSLSLERARYQSSNSISLIELLILGSWQIWNSMEKGPMLSRCSSFQKYLRLLRQGLRQFTNSCAELFHGFCELVSSIFSDSLRYHEIVYGNEISCESSVFCILFRSKHSRISMIEFIARQFSSWTRPQRLWLVWVSLEGRWPRKSYFYIQGSGFRPIRTDFQKIHTIERLCVRGSCTRYLAIAPFMASKGFCAFFDAMTGSYLGLRLLMERPQLL